MSPSAAVAFALLHAVTTPAGLPVRIDWDAPAGCSSPAEFLDGIKVRAEQVRRAEPGDEALHLEVHLGRVAGGPVRGELRIADDTGMSEVRKVEGATCEEVAEALSLTAALALGSTSVARAPHRSATAGGANAVGAGAGASSPPTPAAAPSVAAPPGLSAGPPASAATEVPDPALAPPPIGVPPPASSPPASPSKPIPALSNEAQQEQGAPGSRAVVSFGLGPAVGRIVTPTFEFGLAAHLRVGLRGARNPSPSLDLSATYLRNDVLGAGPAVAVSWIAVALAACPGLGVGGELWTLELCASSAGGRLTAREQAVTVPSSVTRPWASAGAVLRTGLAVGWGIVLQLDVGAQIPFIHRTFVTTTPDRTVAETPSLAGIAGFVVAREL